MLVGGKATKIKPKDLIVQRQLAGWMGACFFTLWRNAVLCSKLKRLEAAVLREGATSALHNGQTSGRRENEQSKQMLPTYDIADASNRSTLETWEAPSTFSPLSCCIRSYTCECMSHLVGGWEDSIARLQMAVALSAWKSLTRSVHDIRPHELKLCNAFDNRLWIRSYTCDCVSGVVGGWEDKVAWLHAAVALRAWNALARSVHQLRFVELNSIKASDKGILIRSHNCDCISGLVGGWEHNTTTLHAVVALVAWKAFAHSVSQLRFADLNLQKASNMVLQTRSRNCDCVSRLVGHWEHAGARLYMVVALKMWKSLARSVRKLTLVELKLCEAHDKALNLALITHYFSNWRLHVFFKRRLSKHFGRGAVHEQLNIRPSMAVVFLVWAAFASLANIHRQQRELDMLAKKRSAEKRIRSRAAVLDMISSNARELKSTALWLWQSSRSRHLSNKPTHGNRVATPCRGSLAELARTILSSWFIFCSYQQANAARLNKIASVSTVWSDLEILRIAFDAWSSHGLALSSVGLRPFGAKVRNGLPEWKGHRLLWGRMVGRTLRDDDSNMSTLFPSPRSTTPRSPRITSQSSMNQCGQEPLGARVDERGGYEAVLEGLLASMERKLRSQ